jgi:hypothetical protein
MSDMSETLRKLIDAGIPPATAQILAMRLAGKATENDVLRALGFR